LKTRTKVTCILAILLMTQCTTSYFLHGAKAEQNGPLSYPGNWCLNFTGTNASYVSCSPDAGNSANLTIEAWVKPAHDISPGSNSNITYGHTYGTIAHHDTVGPDVSGDYGWWFGFDYSTGLLDFRLFQSFGVFPVFSTGLSFWNSSYWYYIAVTYDAAASSGNVKFYVNESASALTLDSSQNGQYAILYHTNPQYPLEIGAQSELTSTNNHFAYVGLMDEFRIWNVSRSQAEIQSSWNRTLDDTETANNNLVGYWRFDDGNGSYATDSSSYNRAGTLLPTESPPQWSIPEFSSIFIMLVLVATSSIGAIILRVLTAQRSKGKNLCRNNGNSTKNLAR
jgi:hypothetical protein